MLIAEKHTHEPKNEEGFPPGAQLCNKCHTKATIMMDGCLT